jgi:hypothetical protein
MNFRKPPLTAIKVFSPFPEKHLIDEKPRGSATELTFPIWRDKAKLTCGLNLTALFFHVFFNREKFRVILVTLI